MTAQCYSRQPLVFKDAPRDMFLDRPGLLNSNYIMALLILVDIDIIFPSS